MQFPRLILVQSNPPRLVPVEDRPDPQPPAAPRLRLLASSEEATERAWADLADSLDAMPTQALALIAAGEVNVQQWAAQRLTGMARRSA